MRAYCVHCGHKPNVWWLRDDHGGYAVIGDHFTLATPYLREPCPGSGVRLVPDLTPPLHVRGLHADACLTPTGITCTCPLEAT